MKIRPLHHWNSPRLIVRLHTITAKHFRSVRRKKRRCGRFRHGASVNWQPKHRFTGSSPATSTREFAPEFSLTGPDRAEVRSASLGVLRRPNPTNGPRLRSPSA